ncbi:hypothetical protein GQR58_015794 [Nymphon striatum]|nr:hypothetical protein GQR58_015794 [Nymphon striatum]
MSQTQPFQFEPKYATDEEGEESLSSSQSNSEDDEKASRISEQSWCDLSDSEHTVFRNSTRSARGVAAGKFTVHQTAGDFNGVWTDLALEQTYNREGKTSLFKGIKQLESAREKYIKALPFITSVSESVKQMAHMTSSQSDHHEKLRKDGMSDSCSLVDAKRLGLKAMDAATTTNADKIVQPKMETFATHLKKIQKKIDTVKEVIKEESAAEVADSWEPLKELSPSSADAVYVVDAMAFIQRFNTLGSSTFGQLQERIFAHIASCDDNNVFVIQATDTDIIVLAMYYFPRLPNVVELWVEKNDLFLSIHDLVNESAKAVGKDVLALTDTLLISYILSGCDSVSYPFKRDLRSLPPTEDAFHFHVLRSLCQISLYKQASLSNPVLLPPKQYGRIVDGDRLIPVMKSKPSKPSAAKLKYCKCKKKPNCLRNCPCAKAAVPCIIACACNGDREKCGRLLTDHYDDDNDDDDDE